MRARKCHIECDCLECGIHRCIYALLIAKNNETLSDEDFEIGQLILAMHLTLEGVNDEY